MNPAAPVRRCVEIFGHLLKRSGKPLYSHGFGLFLDSLWVWANTFYWCLFWVVNSFLNPCDFSANIHEI